MSSEGSKDVCLITTSVFTCWSFFVYIHDSLQICVLSLNSHMYMYIERVHVRVRVHVYKNQLYKVHSDFVLFVPATKVENVLC